MDIEELHKVVVQGFASVNDRIDSVSDRLGARIDSLDARIDSLDAKVDAGFATMDAEFGRVKDALLEHGRQLTSIHAALARKVDRDELGARR
jgi:flagellar capping protein FliD